uniref:Uncharacterized protein n=1 Tax=Sexangularia sp. CB-2014 TaxID=1486929 RepID=A0A7S1Y803_9EUKA|mmetsp:Transcript_10255/g.32536  ORF Transcript_10255/g.32536 Transcript_10255/m.32536 type:complete len:118 (+) Transcript_10255:142-495(+)
MGKSLMRVFAKWWVQLPTRCSARLYLQLCKVILLVHLTRFAKLTREYFNFCSFSRPSHSKRISAYIVNATARFFDSQGSLVPIACLWPRSCTIFWLYRPEKHNMLHDRSMSAMSIAA